MRHSKWVYFQTSSQQKQPQTDSCAEKPNVCLYFFLQFSSPPPPPHSCLSSPLQGFLLFPSRPFPLLPVRYVRSLSLRFTAHPGNHRRHPGNLHAFVQRENNGGRGGGGLTRFCRVQQITGAGARYQTIRLITGGLVFGFLPCVDLKEKKQQHTW